MRYLIIVLSLFLITCGGSTEPKAPELPTVQNIDITTPEDIPKNFAFTGYDPNNLSLTYSIATSPQHGTVAVSGGAGAYIPNANYHGADVFYYIASSSNGNSNIGTVVVTITPVDDEPNTMDATAVTDEDNVVDIALSAEEYDGDNIQFQVRNNPSNGSVTISGETATYTPNQDWNGTDTFNFEAVDSNSKSILNTATATITVNPINDAPIADDMNGEKAYIDESLSITLAGSDIDGDNLTFTIVDNPSNGSVSISGNIATYISSIDGEDSFTFKANDSIEDSNVATVSINTFWRDKSFGDESIIYTTAAAAPNILKETSSGQYLFVAGERTSVWGDNDLMIFSVDSDGSLITTNRYSQGNTSLYAYSIKETTTNQFVLVGSGSGGVEIFMILDENGTILFDKFESYPPNKRFRDVISNSDGSFFVSGGQNIQISKLDNQGNDLEDWDFPGYNESAFFNNLDKTSDGSIIGVFSYTSNEDDGKLTVIKINGNTLVKEWDNTIDLGISGGNAADDIQITSDDGVIICGHLGDPSTDEGFVMKVDSSGNQEWIKFYNNLEARRCIIIDDGYLILLDKDGYSNIVLSKLDNTGNEEFQRIYTGEYSYNGVSLIQTSNGEYIVFGDFDGAGSKENLFLIKLNSNFDRIF